ncbi:hypothetical protein TNCV_4261441 [Trichonephila clavipes]|nr:hypothetical protein TNCV_4261441 [Trichonephila clavipes]
MEDGILPQAVLAGQTVNADYYCRFLQHHLHPATRSKCPCLLLNNLPAVSHDNTRCPVTMSLFYSDGGSEKYWEHSLYSLDMSLCDFDLFTKLKSLSEAADFLMFHLCEAQCIGRHLDRNDMVDARCWKQWITEGTVYHHGGSGRPRNTKAGDAHAIIKQPCSPQQRR